MHTDEKIHKNPQRANNKAHTQTRARRPKLELTPLARQHHRLPDGIDAEAGAAERIAAEQRGQVVDVVLARALLQQPAAHRRSVYGTRKWPATGVQVLASSGCLYTGA